MKKQIDRMLPESDVKRKWLVVAIMAFISGLLTLLGIYGNRDYGFALFVLIPFFIGAGSAILYGLKKGVTKKEAWHLSLITLGVLAAALLVFAVEGVICMVMASPIALFIGWLGSLTGYTIINKTPDSSSAAMMIMICMIPAVGFMEKGLGPDLTSVVTSIEIEADPHTVWKNVIEFPQLAAPEEFIFQTGIAYPVNAKIEGEGVGAVRYCNFTTGSFIEPITVWDEPSLLKFDVEEQPAPMKELSFWDIDAPHLHDYFVSKQGQFKLTKLPNGNTLLEGTTWYYHNIRPAFYWQIWSNYIIHKIHERVLTHIKKNSEAELSALK